MGAEKLLGKGDMLFLPGSYPKSKRLQGAYVSSNEADAVINHWKRQEGPPPPYIQLEPEEGDGSTEDELMLLTNGGRLVRTNVDGISELGRNTQGVRLITLDDNEHLISLGLVVDSAGSKTGVEN